MNRQLICSGSGDKSFQTSTLNLNFDLTTGITSNIAPQTQPTIRPTIRPTQAPIYKPQIQTTKFTQPPRTQEPRTEPATYRPQTQRQTFTAPTQAPSQTQYGPDSQTCGQPILQGTGFIVGGKVATRGQWPW